MSMGETVTASRTNAPAAIGYAIPAHHYPQFWFLLVTLAAFGFYVAWDLNYLRPVFVLDRSYITYLILTLVLLATCHVAWHMFSFSARIEQARACLDQSLARAEISNDFIGQYLEEVDFDPTTGAERPDSDSVIEIFAERLRGPVGLGWFFVDLAVRMGLVGTIIGFVLIFTSLSDNTISGAEGLRELLASMSGGMGTALFTTLTGLVGATLLSFQYLVLGRQVEQLIGLMVQIRNRRAQASSRDGD